MGFRIARRDYRYGMRAFCDYCGKEVVDGECNVLARRNIDEGDEAAIMIACKVVCTDAVDPKKQMANQDLGQCILHLATNAKIDIDKERKRSIDMHEAFGLMF